MKPKTLVRRASEMKEGSPSRMMNDDSSISSAIVGVTLLGDTEDVLAVIRTMVLLARSMKAPLSVSLFGNDILAGHTEEIPSSAAMPEFLDSARAQLFEIAAPAFTMEVNVIAASFVNVGSITMNVHGANAAFMNQRS